MQSVEHFVGTLETAIKGCGAGTPDAQAEWRRNAEAAKALVAAQPAFRDRVNGALLVAKGQAAKGGAQPRMV